MEHADFAESEQKGKKARPNGHAFCESTRRIGAKANRIRR